MEKKKNIGLMINKNSFIHALRNCLSENKYFYSSKNAQTYSFKGPSMDNFY